VDFLEDIQRYEESMQNAYGLITRELTLDDVFFRYEDTGDLENFYLPFDPLESDGRDPGTIDLVIEYMSSIEEYEKCAKLLKIRNRCLKVPID
jgi:hypothetical protein